MRQPVDIAMECLRGCDLAPDWRERRIADLACMSHRVGLAFDPKAGVLELLIHGYLPCV
jgi:hypothetical protein